MSAVTHMQDYRAQRDDSLGFVKLHREMRQQPWYCDSEAKAVFLELVLLAKYADGLVTYKGATVRLQAGQIFTCRKQLSKDLGIHEQKVKRVLDQFEKLGQITRADVHKKGQIITLLNYEKWQKNPQIRDRQNDQQNDQLQPAPQLALAASTDQQNDQQNDRENKKDITRINTNAGSENQPAGDEFSGLRTKAFDHFWKTWSEAKKLIGRKNTADKKVCREKFNKTFPLTYLRKIGVEGFKQEVNRMAQHAWVTHQDIADCETAGTKSDWFNHKHMFPQKFMTLAQWRDAE